MRLSYKGRGSRIPLMLIALLTDIHGNREAFEACLHDARRMRADRFVFLGDYVGYGADPGFVVDAVAGMVEEGAVALLGNHDEAVFRPSERMNPLATAAIDWTRGRLDAAQCAFLRERPLLAEEGERLFVHANAYDPAGWDYMTDRMQAAQSMTATQCRTTFCGHVHVPAVFHMAAGARPAEFTPVPGTGIPLPPPRRWLAVIGAVGQPRDGDPAACYALLHAEESTLTYIRVAYDIDAAARKIVRAGLPPRLAARLYRGH
ncbi:MAG: metallophosphoesterase [Microvirga sp.]|nr:metallophosphoesterase [Microvirga sp.]